MLTQTEIALLVRKIVQRMEPEKVIVFGSFAKGTATYKSDLDLFIIKDTHLPMYARDEDIRPIINNMLIKVDVHVYTPEEVEAYGNEPYSFVNSILNTGMVFFERK